MEKNGHSRAPGMMSVMRPKLMIVSVAAGLASALIVVYSFSPRDYSFYPRCPFYTATHLLCPGCGATRALDSLLHGDWAGALHSNAMFTLLVPVFLGWFVFCCYHTMRYDRFPRLIVPRGVWLGAGIVVLLFTVARNTLFAI